MSGVSPLVAAEGEQPLATVTPSVLNVYQGQRAEFRCTATGNPSPAIEWIGATSSNSTTCAPRLPPHPTVTTVIVAGGPGNRMSPRAVIRGGALSFAVVDPADEGEYTCKALNTHGEHTARVSLFVQSMLSVKLCVRSVLVLLSNKGVF